MGASSLAAAACEFARSTFRRRRAIRAFARSCRSPDDIAERDIALYRRTSRRSRRGFARRRRGEALRLIRVDYQTLPFIVDLDEARETGAPLVYDGAARPGGHPSGFPRPPAAAQWQRARARISRRGDVARGFAEADVVVEGEYARMCRPIAAPSRTRSSRIGATRPDRLHVDPVYRRRAGRNRRDIRPAAQSRSRHRRRHGRRLWLEIQLGNYGRFAVELSRARGAGAPLLDREEEQMDAGNRPAHGSACASAPNGTAR